MTPTAGLRGRSGKVADNTVGPDTTFVTFEHEGKQALRYAFTITEHPAVEPR